MSTETIQWITDPYAFPEAPNRFWGVECLLTVVARHNGERFVTPGRYWPGPCKEPGDFRGANGHPLGVMGWDLVAWAKWPEGFKNE